jgi:hypothetical protein
MKSLLETESLCLFFLWVLFVFCFFLGWFLVLLERVTAADFGAGVEIAGVWPLALREILRVWSSRVNIYPPRETKSHLFTFIVNEKSS